MQLQDFRLPSQWALRQEDESVAVFQNADGDALSINHFNKIPDIAADIADTGALRSFYRMAAESNGVAMIEVDSMQVAGLPAVRTILKARLQPRGFAFIGSFTFPFADCSYVLKVQSVEHGITGAREAAVLLMQEKPAEADERTGKIIGWEQDPYDAAHHAPFMRNRADDEKYDAAFPDHPLSRVRRHLRQLSQELEVAPTIRAARPFKYKAPKRGIWARLWK
jgi:hypothetical protein